MTVEEAKAKLERTSVLWQSATNTEMTEAVQIAIKTLDDQIRIKENLADENMCNNQILIKFVIDQKMNRLEVSQNGKE